VYDVREPGLGVFDVRERDSELEPTRSFAVEDKANNMLFLCLPESPDNPSPRHSLCKLLERNGFASTRDKQKR